MLKKLIVMLICAVLWQPTWAAGEPVAQDYINYIELKPFVANFGGPGKPRFVKCELTIQVTSPAAHHAVNYHMAHIRNDIVFLLSEQQEENLNTVEAQQILAQRALRLVQNILVAEEGEAFVTDLFFTSFVTQ